MVRRLQLLEPEHRSSGRRLAALGNRIRDGLLRDNKVIPAVLGVLALLIFAWVVAGALTGGSNDQGRQQASNQGSVSQAPEKSSGSESTGTPAPEAENRDTDSYSAFKAKDPFRQIVPPAARETTTKESTRESTARESGNSGGSSNSRSGGSSRGSSNSRSGGGTGGSSANTGDSSANNDEDFIDETSPGNSSRGVGGGGSRGTGDDSSDGGTDQAGGTDQGGNDNLFNSGGDLAP